MKGLTERFGKFDDIVHEEEKERLALKMPLMNILEERLQELFANPHMSGEHAYEVTVSGNGNVQVQCPYCYWTNTHNTNNGGGPRECDGPIDSEWDFSDEVGRRRDNYQMYECPGYTLCII